MGGNCHDTPSYHPPTQPQSSQGGTPPWLTVLFLGYRSEASLTVRYWRPSLLIPQCKQWSFLHAWLSSLRKTDGLKFLSLFGMFFFFVFFFLGSWGVQPAAAVHVHCSFNVENQRSDDRPTACLIIRACGTESSCLYINWLLSASGKIAYAQGKRSLINKVQPRLSTPYTCLYLPICPCMFLVCIS